MRVIFSGFNLYGQLIKSDSSIVESFIDFDYEDITNLVLGYSFCVASADSRLYLHGAYENKTRHIQEIDLPTHPKVVQICCTNNRILFLNDRGIIFKLDIDKTNTLSILPKFLDVDDRDDDKEEDKIIKIASRSHISVAVSEKGKVFNIPTKLNFSCDNIIDICTGREHCLLLDGRGNIYSFGRGSRGQLGHGVLEDEIEPKLVERLAGIPIAKIAAGGWHSCAVSRDGDLYTWGWNSNGQLALSAASATVHISIMALPQVVDFYDPENSQNCFDDVNIAKVCCGNRHTIVLAVDQSLFGCGWNRYHQLGQIEDENVYKMTVLEKFSNVDVLDLRCGPWSSAVLVH